LRTNFFNIVLSAMFLTILGVAESHAQEDNPRKIQVPIIEPPVTQSDTLALEGLITPIIDSTATDSVKTKPILADKIKYKAEEYAKIDQRKKHITLYDKSELYYQDIELKAGIIVIDYAKKEVYAGRIRDSLGNYTQLPVFKQGLNVVEPDSIRFNFDTKKALVWNSRTQQGELNVKAEITKKENDSVYFMKNARITTAQDIENPEYYLLAREVKFVPGKKVVVGLTNMVIADVPTPLALPFAFFPMSQKATSGILVPTYGDSRQRGYSLQNGGYYFALSDHYDLAVLGDYYTNGSWGLRFDSRYAKRYAFAGNINFRFENLITSERGFPDYSKTKIYNIQWSHSKDPKSNPNQRFSASVNLGSSRYFQQSINQVNVGSQLNNTLSSSISYSTTIQTIPQINLSLAATHQQNTQTQTINMTLPTFQANVDRIFPFAPKDGIKKGFFKNINLQYSVRGENRVTTTDSLFFKPEMFRDMQSGFQHSIPLSTNFKIFKYFSATTSVNYQEVWYLKTIEKAYDPSVNTVVTNDVHGFDAFRTYSFNSSLGTTIYGTFQFGEEKKIQAIRHVMRPSVSYSYTPSFENYWDTYDPNGTGQMQTPYTRFEGGIFGAPGRTMASNVGFSLSNTFEAKVRDKDSTQTQPKKVMLLNNLNFSTAYNLAADSLRWAPVRMSGGTTFFDNAMNVNFAATMDAYAIDNNGRRINKWNIDNGGSLFRLTSANMNIGYTLSSRGTKDKKSKNNQGLRNGGREDDLFGTNTDFSDRRDSQFDQDEDEEEKNTVSEFFRTKIPWDLTLAHSLTYGNMARQNEITGNSLMVSVNTDLTPRWRVGVSTGYDFVQKGVTFTQFRFERDLLSWRMDFNWTPFGDQSYWGFFIGIKAGVLQDVKYEKRTQPDRVLR
jgi:lipopolysaccharide assembly outer membrane protein LptD (OstA)